jgi:hypothetical protein
LLDEDYVVLMGEASDLAECSERDAYIDYLRGLLSRSEGVCVRLAAAYHLAEETGDTNYIEIVESLLRDESVVEKCWEAVGHVISRCPRWLSVGRLKSLYRVARRVLNRRPELWQTPIDRDTVDCIVRRLAVEEGDAGATLAVLQEYARDFDEGFEASVLEDFMESLVDSNQFSTVLAFLEAVGGSELRDRVLASLAGRLAGLGRYEEAVELLKHVSNKVTRENTVSTIKTLIIESGSPDKLTILSRVPGVDRDELLLEVAEELASRGRCAEAYRTALNTSRGKKVDPTRDKVLVSIARCFAERELFSEAVEAARRISNPLYRAYALLLTASSMYARELPGYEALVEEALNQLEEQDEDSEELDEAFQGYLWLDSMWVYGLIVEELAFLGLEPKPSQFYLDRVAVGLARRGDIARALEIAKSLSGSSRVRAYEGILRVLARLGRAEAVMEVARELEQDVYDDIVVPIAKEYVEGGGSVHTALKLLERAKCLKTVLEGLIGVAVALVEHRRYDGASVVVERLLDNLRRATRQLVRELNLAGLVEKLGRVGMHEDALRLVKAVGEIDRSVVLEAVRELARAAVATETLSTLAKSIQRHPSTVDRELLKTVVSEVASSLALKRLRAEDLTPLEKLVSKLQAEVDRALKQVDRVLAETGNPATALTWFLKEGVRTHQA